MSCGGVVTGTGVIGVAGTAGIIIAGGGITTAVGGGIITAVGGGTIITGGGIITAGGDKRFGAFAWAGRRDALAPAVSSIRAQVDPAAVTS